MDKAYLTHEQATALGVAVSRVDAGCGPCISTLLVELGKIFTLPRHEFFQAVEKGTYLTVQEIEEAFDGK